MLAIAHTDPNEKYRLLRFRHGNRNARVSGKGCETQFALFLSPMLHIVGMENELGARQMPRIPLDLLIPAGERPPEVIHVLR